ncbi:hypothetical protein [Carboxylicivirga sp. RSCT41]|uniref:hypothetical protein n=1 Tax=Carboxylicivirga agarovorans TaxID=3417570 RepID=UPI003D354A3B
MLSSGNILHIDNFEFRDGSSKDKFLIVICNRGNDYVVINLTSSQVYVNDKDIVCGCIHTENKHCYHFPAKKVIGVNGFAFPKNTFVYFSQLTPIKAELISKKYIETNQAKLVDTLAEGEYNELVYCAYKGDQVNKRVKLILEEYLKDIYGSDQEE